MGAFKLYFSYPGEINSKIQQTFECQFNALLQSYMKGQKMPFPLCYKKSWNFISCSSMTKSIKEKLDAINTIFWYFKRYYKSVKRNQQSM